MYRRFATAVVALVLGLTAAGFAPASASTSAPAPTAPYRTARTCWGDYLAGCVIIATYPGIVKAWTVTNMGYPRHMDVWIDSTHAIHNAHGEDYAEWRTPRNPGWKWRSCTWAVTWQLGHYEVVCSPWVQGY